MTGRLIAIAAALLTASAAHATTLFVAEYDGNTGNAGLNADLAVGTPVASSVGLAVIDGADKKYGTGSLDPSAASPGGNALTYQTAGNFTIGPSSAGTIEMWVKTTINPSVEKQQLFTMYQPGFVGTVDLHIFTGNVGQFGETRIRAVLDTDSSGGGVYFQDTSLLNHTWDNDAWHHVAWNWDLSDPDPLNDFSTLYIDGVAESFGGFGTLQYPGTVGATFEIGSQQGGYDPLLGRIDSVRISDTAVYGQVSNFTPPGPFVQNLLLGDADNSGTVTADDLIAVQQNFGNVGPNGDGTDIGDANDDGSVTADDLISVQQNFGNTLGATGSALPEPATLGLLALLGLAMSGKRRDSIRESRYDPRSSESDPCRTEGRKEA